MKKNSKIYIAGYRELIDFARINNEDIVIWGIGKVRREFISEEEQINIRTGNDLIINKFIEIFKEVTDFKGKIIYNKTKLDRILRKLLDVKKLENLRWKYKIELTNGKKEVYKSSNWRVNNE